MWFLTLIPSAAWKYLGLIAAAGALYAYADVKATHREHAKCEAAAAAAQAAANDQDLKAEKEGRAQDLEITNSLVEQKKVDDEAIRKLKADLAKNPLAASCVYPVDAPASRGGLRKSGSAKPGASNPKPSRTP